MTEYDIASTKNNGEKAIFDRAYSRETALRIAHALAYDGYSSVISDIESGAIVDEVIVYNQTQA